MMMVATVVSSSCCWLNTMTFLPPISLTSILRENLRGEVVVREMRRGRSSKKKRVKIMI